MRVLIGLFKKIDLYLLTHHPVLWTVRIHYVIIVGIVVSMIGVSYAFYCPSLSSHLIEPDIFLWFLIPYFVVCIIYWIYLQSRFSLSMNYGIKSRFHEFYRTIVFLIVLIVLCSPLLSMPALQFRISSLFSDEQQHLIKSRHRKEILKKYDLGDVRYTWGFFNLFYVDSNSSELRDNVGSVNFQVLDELNKIYGDRKLFGSPSDLEQSYNLGINKRSVEFVNYINVLEKNIYKIERAFNYCDSEELVLSILCLLLYIVSTSFLILTFTSTYQYFGLKFLLLGILTSCACVAAHIIVFNVINNGVYLRGKLSSVESSGLYIMFVLLIFQIWWIHYKLKYLKSKRTFYVLSSQYLITLIPMAIFFCFVLANEKEWYILPTDNGLERIAIFSILTFLYYFTYVPYLKGSFYKLYLLPQKD
ncbi:MAG: hypothetical protein GY777_10495 [Candidatus Brocadiaceae bacterium]|nr:hypothetical protein [Candidatus Brocadiaceae bacterium]